MLIPRTLVLKIDPGNSLLKMCSEEELRKLLTVPLERIVIFAESIH